MVDSETPNEKLWTTDFTARSQDRQGSPHRLLKSRSIKCDPAGKRQYCRSRPITAACAILRAMYYISVLFCPRNDPDSVAIDPLNHKHPCLSLYPRLGFGRGKPSTLLALTIRNGHLQKALAVRATNPSDWTLQGRHIHFHFLCNLFFHFWFIRTIITLRYFTSHRFEARPSASRRSSARRRDHYSTQLHDERSWIPKSNYPKFKFCFHPWDWRLSRTGRVWSFDEWNTIPKRGALI